ncbi:hypothetical protein ACP275_11G042700 [Erythranthe tilingii]
MITILLSSLLFIFSLIFIKFSNTKKYLKNIKTPPQDSPPLSNPTSTKPKPAADLRGVFATFDKNNDGYITKHELTESLKKIGIEAGESDVADMVQRVDSNGDGLIDFDEFCVLFDSFKDDDEQGQVKVHEDGDLREAFDVFDENRDGLISVEELGLVLSSMGFNQGNRIDDCKEMIRRVDVDGDGMVDFDEFRNMMKSGFARFVAVSS